MIKVKTLRLLLIFIACCFELNSFAQRKLDVNQKSEFPGNFDNKYRFLGSTNEYAFYFNINEKEANFLKVSSTGDILNKSKLVLKETKFSKKFFISNLIVLDGNPVVIYYAYDKNDNEWKTYANFINEDGVIQGKEDVVVDESKISENGRYLPPEILLNKEQTKFVMVRFGDKNLNYFGYENYKDFQKVTVTLFDNNLVRQHTKEYNIQIPERGFIASVSRIFESNKMMFVLRTTGSEKNLMSNRILTRSLSFSHYPADLDDFIVTCDLDNDKVLFKKVISEDRGVLISILHLKDKIVYTGVVFKNKIYTHIQFISQYDLLTDKINTKQFTIPDEVIKKLNIHLLDSLSYGDQFYISHEASTCTNNDSYIIVLILHKVLKDRSFNSMRRVVSSSFSTATEVITADFGFANVNVNQAEITHNLIEDYNYVTGKVVNDEFQFSRFRIKRNYIATSSKLVTFILKSENGDKELIEKDITADGNVKENVVYTFAKDESIVLDNYSAINSFATDSYSGINMGTIKDASIIFQIKKGDKCYFATLDAN